MGRAHIPWYGYWGHRMTCKNWFAASTMWGQELNSGQQSCRKALPPLCYHKDTHTDTHIHGDTQIYTHRHRDTHIHRYIHTQADRKAHTHTHINEFVFPLCPVPSTWAKSLTGSFSSVPDGSISVITSLASMSRLWWRFCVTEVKSALAFLKLSVVIWVFLFFPCLFILSFLTLGQSLAGPFAFQWKPLPWGIIKIHCLIHWIWLRCYHNFKLKERASASSKG